MLPFTFQVKISKNTRWQGRIQGGGGGGAPGARPPPPPQNWKKYDFLA